MLKLTKTSIAELCHEASASFGVTAWPHPISRERPGAPSVIDGAMTKRSGVERVWGVRSSASDRPFEYDARGGGRTRIPSSETLCRLAD